jgi:hypothetical protein
MKRVAKASLAVLVIVALCIFVLKAVLLGLAWKRQVAAERILAAVRTLQPEVSSCAELQQKVFTPNPEFYLERGKGNSEDQHAYAAIYNQTDIGIEHLPDFLREPLVKLLLPRWTMFEVTLHCSAGKLARITVLEMQEVEGWPHPYSVKTEIVDAWPPDDPELRGITASERHYHVYEQGTSLYVDNKLIRQSPTLGRWISLDRYATPIERSKALDFHLNCFTRLRGCQDTNLILQPAPKR